MKDYNTVNTMPTIDIYSIFVLKKKTNKRFSKIYIFLKIEKNNLFLQVDRKLKDSDLKYFSSCNILINVPQFHVVLWNFMLAELAQVTQLSYTSSRS